jgi:hypothetical protein
VTCIRLDATVTPAHSDEELAEANFKGFELLTELLGALPAHRAGAPAAPRMDGTPPLFLNGLCESSHGIGDVGGLRDLECR